MRDFIKDPTGSFRWMRMLFFSFLMLLLYPLGIQAQDITLKGVVSDGTGESLPGVSVLVKGTSNGTITDAEGKYSLNVKSSDVVIFSFVGMKTQEYKVAGRTVINVQMKDDTELLDEVVVVGYGTQKKSSLTSAVSAMKLSLIHI